MKSVFHRESEKCLKGVLKGTSCNFFYTSTAENISGLSGTGPYLILAEESTTLSSATLVRAGLRPSIGCETYMGKVESSNGKLTFYVSADSKSQDTNSMQSSLKESAENNKLDFPASFAAMLKSAVVKTQWTMSRLYTPRTN